MEEKKEKKKRVNFYFLFLLLHLLLHETRFGFSLLLALLSIHFRINYPSLTGIYF